MLHGDDVFARREIHTWAGLLSMRDLLGFFANEPVCLTSLKQAGLSVARVHGER